MLLEFDVIILNLLVIDFIVFKEKVVYVVNVLSEISIEKEILYNIVLIENFVQEFGDKLLLDFKMKYILVEQIYGIVDQWYLNEVE